MNPPRRIVVRTPNWLGDVVMATPGFRALRRAHPEAEIVGLVPEPLVPVLEGSGDFDALWPLPMRARGRRGPSLRKGAARLAQEPFDLGIAIPESISSALMLRLGRVRRIIGFSRDPLRSALLHEVVPAEPEWGPRRWVSKERFVLRLMAAAGACADDVRTRLVVTESETERLRVAFESLGGSLDSLTAHAPVVIAPGAAFGDSKCWPTARFAALASELLHAGTPVVLVGTAAEQQRLASVRSEIRATGPAVSGGLWMFAGTLDLGALKALIQRAAVLVGNDSGARHLASALGVPSVAFFGPTAVEKTADNLDLVQVLETEHDCRPCYQRNCPDRSPLSDLDFGRGGSGRARSSRGGTSMIDVSIVVASYETRAALGACLASVEAATRAASSLTIETIVIDNGSRDGSAAWVAEAYPGIRLQALVRNRGFAAAMNRGMRSARGRFILLLNSDAELAEDFLSVGAGLLDAASEVGVLGAALEHPDGRPQRSVHALPGWRSEFWPGRRRERLPANRAAAQGEGTRGCIRGSTGAGFGAVAARGGDLDSRGHARGSGVPE